MKFYTAFTDEIDDPEVAAKEILEQLEPKKNMLKNTVGLVFFHYDFAADDIWREFAKAMPFPLFGCVSSYIGTGKRYGDAAVSIVMLTGDDVSFAVKTVGGLSGKTSDAILSDIEAACSGLCAGVAPKMIIPFWSQQLHFSGDDFIDMTNKLPERVPFYGMIVYDVDGVPNTNFVLADGVMSSEQFGALAIYGNVSPTFYVSTSLDMGSSLGSEAVITEAEGNVLKAVDNMPTFEYLKKLGLIDENGKLINSEIWAIPAVMTFPDGRKYVRAFNGIVEGTEYLSSTGRIETGVKIGFSLLDAERTIESAKNAVKRVIDAGQNDVLVFSCVARAWAMGAKLMAEAHALTAEKVACSGEPLRHCTAYTGGEICPVQDGDGNLVNALHNYTLVACAFN